MREAFTNIKRRIFKVDAVFTRFSRLKNKITIIIKTDVKIMEKWGVPDFSFTFLKMCGKR